MKHNNAPFKYSFSTQIVINANKAQAWEVLQDFSNVHAWAPTVSASYQIGKPEKGVGHGRHCDIDGFGGLDEIITQWREGEGFEYSVTPIGPLAASSSHWSLEEIDVAHTRLTVSLSYNLRFGLLGKLLHGLIMKQKLKASLADTGVAVKDRVESQASKRIDTPAFELRKASLA